MKDCVVTLSAPCRLHFGLLAFGQASGPQYGGAGLMIDAPALELKAHPAPRFQAVGPHAERVTAFANRWAASHGLPEPPPCQVHVVAAPPAHVGLGLGTQLALAVGAALQCLCDFPELPPTELARRLQRGQRSAVGTYGFASGGLLIDSGKEPGQDIAPPARRIELCRDWRFVLLRPRQSAGLCGPAEHAAFESLPPVPLATTAELVRELQRNLVPAAERGECDEFGESLYRYGRLSGECFSRVQGGPYNGPVLQRLVETLRSWGVLGVGQSSWGPTLFALVRNRSEGSDLLFRLEQRFGDDLELSLAAPAHRGAQLRLG